MGIQVKYDLNLVAVVVAGIAIDALTTDGISHAFDDDDWVHTQGSGGSTIKARKFNNLSTLTVSVLQGSLANSQLTGLRNAGLFANSFSILVKDVNGDTVISTAQADVMKVPDFQLGMEASPRAWQFKLHSPTVILGSNIPS